MNFLSAADSGEQREGQLDRDMRRVRSLVGRKDMARAQRDLLAARNQNCLLGARQSSREISRLARLEHRLRLPLTTRVMRRGGMDVANGLC